MVTYTTSSAKDKFYGIYYPYEEERAYASIILMIGPNSDGALAKMGVKYLHSLGVNVLVMSYEHNETGYKKFEIEKFKYAINYLKEHGNHQFGIAGASVTSTLALLAASYFDEITLTICFSPNDFVLEGYIRDRLDKCIERPSNTSIATYEGKELPYLPYCYRHPEYSNKLKEEAKLSHNVAASRKMFDKSEAELPILEEAFIKVENINGTLVLVGASDDSLWDTVRYIKRMEERCKTSYVNLLVITYEVGTHFLAPYSMLKAKLHFLDNVPYLLFDSGRKNLKEIKNNRKDLDNKLKSIIRNWIANNTPFLH